MDVLKMATANAAELLGMEDQLGSVEEGRLADLVILDGNPLDDIKNTLRISKVIKSGKVYAPVR
jgi:imidazolonepropionase-like amidohydrolase